MCGRYTLRTDLREIAKHFGVTEVPSMTPRYNISPTQEVAIIKVTDEAQGREMDLYRWGLIPSWAKDPSIGSKMINARAETVAEKPSFREAFKHRRGLIPADGFYEWARAGTRKQPYYFLMKNEQPFAFAGLWENWQSDGERINSCTIITTEANELLRQVHDRMPVILHPEDYEMWLDEDVRKTDLLKELLQPYPAQEMTAYPVSTLVNSTRQQGAGLVDQLKINSA
jgi:putative SOS response-associated peptidase YedK